MSAATTTHVTFIHGLANKPPTADLRRLWLEALRFDRPDNRGFDLEADGVTESFVYWADLFYEKPLSAKDYEAGGDELAASIQGANSALPSDDWMAAMRRHYPEAGAGYEAPPPAAADAPVYERIPLPEPLKEALMAEFLREAHAYLFNKDGLRDVIRERVLQSLHMAPPDTRHVIVSHSQGTFIAYDVLTACDACPPIAGFMTVGSPLGLDEVQDRLVWTRTEGFPAKLQGDWVNVYDAYDLVSRPDPRLANDFLKHGLPAVIDVAESNWGPWRHAATKYMKGKQLRTQLRRLCGRELP